MRARLLKTLGSLPGLGYVNNGVRSKSSNFAAISPETIYQLTYADKRLVDSFAEISAKSCKFLFWV